MTIGYLKRKAKEYELALRSRDRNKIYQDTVDIQKAIVENFIQYLEESK